MKFYTLIFVCFFNVFAGFSQEIIYVNSVLGNDTLNGLLPNIGVVPGEGPKKTINAALELAENGDILSVEVGFYDEAVVLEKSIQLIKTGQGSIEISEWSFYPESDLFGNLPVEGAFNVESVKIHPGAQLSDAVLLVAENGNLFFNEGGFYTENLVVRKSFTIITNDYVVLLGIRMDANGGTLTLGGRFEVSDFVQLNQLNGGFIELSANNLTINPNATVTGGSSLSYIKTSGSGSLVMTTQGDPIVFPVGSATTFAPVSLDELSILPENIAVRVREALNLNSFNPDLPSSVNSFVGLEWVFEESIPGGNNVNVRFDYTGNNELNNWAAAQNRSVYRNDGSTWTAGTNSSVDQSFSSADFSDLGGVFAIYSDFPNAVFSNQDSRLLAYPNPVSDVLFVKGLSDSNVSFELYSIEGKCVRTGIVTSAAFDLSGLQSGAYLLKLISESGVATIPVVKN